MDIQKGGTKIVSSVKMLKIAWFFLNLFAFLLFLYGKRNEDLFLLKVTQLTTKNKTKIYIISRLGNCKLWIKFSKYLKLSINSARICV